MEKQKKKQTIFRTGVILALVAVAFALGFWVGGREGGMPPSADHGHDLVMPGKTEASVTWTCSMHPQIRLPGPGQCPICFMDLIPLRQEGQGSGGQTLSLRQITLTDEARRLAELAVEPVLRRPVAVETRMVGKADYDETRLSYITTWMAGRIDKLYVDYTGSPVSRGQPMASIYSPELLTAQAELIQAVSALQALQESGLKRVRDAAEQTERAAREKLRLLGLTNRQIEEVVQRRSPSDHTTLHAPSGGIVIKKDVLEGMYVQTGTRIYTIADLSRVWVVLEVYESDLPWVKMGQEVAFQTEAHPGEVYKGPVVYIDPRVDEKTRTVQVRLDVSNLQGRLKPGMFVRAVKRTSAEGAEEALVIPASAPLVTGKRAIVYVQVPGQEETYEGREIVLGPRAGDVYIVRAGLSEGELVVTKGNFRIDSAVQLLAKPSMMNPGGLQAAQERHHGGPTPSAGDVHEDAEPIPYPFAKELTRLAEAYERVRAAVELKDLDEMKKAWQAFRETLQALDTAALPPHLALLWKEMAMLLRNDAYLGSEADTAEEGVRLFATLAEHFQAVRGPFQLGQLLQTQAVSVSVPEVFKAATGTLLQDYLALQAALASDDFPLARKAGERFVETLAGMDMGLLDGNAHTLWMTALKILKEGTTRTAAAEEIEAFRGGFERLSVGMARVIEGLGVGVQGPVFELYCPMAFRDQGATWLQQDEDIFNPYFGARMLKCGEVRRQLKRADHDPKNTGIKG